MPNHPIAGPPAYFTFRGFRFYRTRTGHYQDRTGNLLHHAVWVETHGPIPGGKILHHIDGDPANNRLDNLEAVTRAEHLEHHAPAVKGDPRFVEAGKRAAATLWANREPREVVCAHCGGTYYSTGMRARFCSDNCRANFYRRERRDVLKL